MFATKSRRTRQLVCRLTAILLVALLLVSCGGKVPSGKDKPVDEGKPQVTLQPDKQQDSKPEQQDEKQDTSQDQQDAGSDMSGPAGTAAEFFSAYSQAKGDVVTILTEALTSNPETAFDAMSLIGVSLVDMALLPATSFGLGQEAAVMALGFLGGEDIVYNENGNQYSIKYKNSEGEQCELQGVYDKAAGSLICTAILNGKEILITEHRKTSFGFVGQIYSVNDNGTSQIYQLALSGKDGAVGITEASSAPPALTGSETIDFPKQCKEWYAIKGDAFTGVNAMGKELSFTYTPSEDG
jgi:hypothetical protein